MFPWGCGRKGCCQQVSEGASDAYALACERRQTFSGHKSMQNRLYSNFTADVDNALLFLHRKRYWLTRHGREIYLSVSFHRCHLASSVKQISWDQSRGIFQCIYIKLRGHGFEHLGSILWHRYHLLSSSSSSLSWHASESLLLSLSRYQTNPAACEHVIMPWFCMLPPNAYVDVGTVGSLNVSSDLAKLALAPD